MPVQPPSFSWRHPRLQSAVLLLLGMLCTLAQSAPDEIVVFTDEFEKKGEVGYSLHVNYAARARRVPEYAGEQAPYRVLRVMPEIVWGLTDAWNFGLHIPFSYSRSTRDATLDGVKLRLQNLHVRERGHDNNTFYGVNYEVSYYDRRITESRFNGELRGILGINQGDWKLTLNPIVNLALSANPSGRRPEFELFGQVMRAFGPDLALGIEHYASVGRVSRPTYGSESGQISYLVADFKTKRHFDIHLGIGHGWTSGTSDKLVFKALLGLPF